ncbi:MAG TPA: pitrilysin family protein, partial [Vicinamibacterales bacterium]|nr:pitrilysin family protein [Vicinamibacterales bacterium]
TPLGIVGIGSRHVRNRKEVSMRVLRSRLWLALAGMCALTVVVVTASTPKVTFTDTRLKNGLRVIIAEDHAAPVFSIAVSYNVGSRDERKGRTGFAHLFEHMMFKGSENVGPGEHFTLVFNNGGNMNGTTNKDRTLYFETLPSNQLELALFLEADRMRSLEITKENLDNQRHAVQEERRLGLDNQPYGKTFEAIDDLAYDNFAYEHSVIGSMEDLNAASVEDVASFFKTYYAPNNAVLAIVGDVKAADCLARVRKHFEGVPSQTPPPPVDMTEPAQTAERRLTLDDQLARLTRLDLAYKIPPAMSPDEYPLSVLATVLAGGRSSRLYEQVVRQQQLAPTVFANAGTFRGPGLFRVGGMVSPGKAVADLERAIDEEIEKVKTGTIADWEIQKARRTARSAFVSSVGSSLSRAVLLSQYALFYDDPGLINTRADKIAAVTARDVQQAARKYLTRENRTVVITNPRTAGTSNQGGL